LKLIPSKERTVVNPYEVPEVKPITIPIKKEIPSASNSGAYYGVGSGLDGVHGVFRSWGEVAPLVMGVSKAVYRRCWRIMFWEESGTTYYILINLHE